MKTQFIPSIDHLQCSLQFAHSIRKGKPCIAAINFGRERDHYNDTTLNHTKVFLDSEFPMNQLAGALFWIGQVAKLRCSLAHTYHKKPSLGASKARAWICLFPVTSFDVDNIVFIWQWLNGCSSSVVEDCSLEPDSPKFICKWWSWYSDACIWQRPYLFCVYIGCSTGGLQSLRTTPINIDNDDSDYEVLWCQKSFNKRLFGLPCWIKQMSEAATLRVLIWFDSCVILHASLKDSWGVSRWG